MINWRTKEPFEQRAKPSERKINMIIEKIIGFFGQNESSQPAGHAEGDAHLSSRTVEVRNGAGASQ